MDKVEKMDCGANGEVILCAMSPLLSQSPKLSDPISQRIGLTGKRNRGTVSSHLTQQQRIILTGKYEKWIMENDG